MPSWSGAKRAAARIVVPGFGARALKASAWPAAAGRNASPLEGKDATRSGRCTPNSSARPVRPVLQRLRRRPARGRPADGAAGGAGASTHRAAHALGALFACTEGHEGDSRAGPRQGPEDDGGRLDQPPTGRNETRDRGADPAREGRPGRHRGGRQRGAAARRTAEAGTAGLHRARQAAVPEGVPVGCVDAYYQFLERPALAAGLRRAAANCYPFWEGADIALAGSTCAACTGSLVAAAGGTRPSSSRDRLARKRPAVGAAVPSAENAMRYFIDVQQWAPWRGDPAVLLRVVRRALEARRRRAKWARSGACGTRTGSSSTAAEALRVLASVARATTRSEQRRPSLAAGAVPGLHRARAASDW